MTEMTTDILIIGGGTGGVAAALSVAQMGLSCIVTEPTDWLGGQLTSQAVPPDENQWIESFGGTRRYQTLREHVRRHYQTHPHIASDLPDAARLNPGGGWVSRLCASPAVWHQVLADQIGAAGNKITTLLETEPVSAQTEADRVTGVLVRSTRTGEERFIRAAFYLDATELGDLLALANVEHDVGAEHQSVYGELHGRTDFPAHQRIDPLDQQACSWCFALEHLPGEDHTIQKPEHYDRFAGYVPVMKPEWCGPLFSWKVPSHAPPGSRDLSMTPWPDEPATGVLEMWRYRRIADRANYRPEFQPLHPDVALINMVQMDFWQRPLLGGGPGGLAAALGEAREQSRCFLYWMQTAAPRHDSSTRAGYPGLRLCGEELGTTDGFAKAVYVREPRRLLARTMVTEAHIGTEQRRADGAATPELRWDETPFGTAHRFADSVGIGHYMIDLHPSCAGRNNVYVPAAPFRIPMGALIPRRVRNVLSAGKAMGLTHITNGCYRMHHVEWNAGESAGLLAAWCKAVGTEPHAVHASPERVRDFQALLAEHGVRTVWPWET